MTSAVSRGRPAIVAKTDLALNGSHVAAVRQVGDGNTVQIELPTGWDMLQITRNVTKGGTTTKVKLVSQSLVLNGGKDKASLALANGKSLNVSLVGDGQSVLVTLPDGWDVASFTRSPIADAGRTKATFTSSIQTADEKEAASNSLAPTPAPATTTAATGTARKATKVPAKRAAKTAAKPAAKAVDKPVTKAAAKVPAKTRPTRARTAKKATSAAG